MSTLQVSNICFDSAGDSRIQYTGSNTFVLVANGINVFSCNTSSIQIFGTNINDIKGNIPVINVGSTGTYTTTANDVGKMLMTTANIVVNSAVFVPGDHFHIFSNPTNTNNNISFYVIPGQNTILLTRTPVDNVGKLFNVTGYTKVTMVDANSTHGWFSMSVGMGIN